MPKASLWDKGVLLTINCRVTGMVKIEPLKNKTAEQVYEATIRTLEEWKPWLHTITSDNGKKFAPKESFGPSTHK